MDALKRFFDEISPVANTSWPHFDRLFNEDFLKRGDYFIKDGEVAKTIGFLESGIIRGYYRSKEGMEYNKHFFTHPCMIGGYSSFITGKPNQINQQALTDCVIYTARYADIQDLYEAHPTIERVARVLAEQFFVQKEQREIELVLLDAEKRYEIFRRDFPGLEQQIPQYHIASYLGISATQLSRIRRKMVS